MGIAQITWELSINPLKVAITQAQMNIIVSSTTSHIFILDVNYCLRQNRRFCVGYVFAPVYLLLGEIFNFAKYVGCFVTLYICLYVCMFVCLFVYRLQATILSEFDRNFFPE